MFDDDDTDETESPTFPLADSSGRVGIRVTLSDGTHEDFVNQNLLVVFDAETNKPAIGWSKEDLDQSDADSVPLVFFRAWPSVNREILYIERCKVDTSTYEINEDQMITYSFDRAQDAMYVAGAWLSVRAVD